MNNKSAPWTSDYILQTYKFTNTYRASDRVSQYLINNVIYTGGFIACSPCINSIKKEWGNYKNPFENIANGDELYYISLSPERENFDMLKTYIYEHYGKNVEPQIIDIVEDYYYIYKFE